MINLTSDQIVRAYQINSDKRFQKIMMSEATKLFNDFMKAGKLDNVAEPQVCLNDILIDLNELEVKLGLADKKAQCWYFLIFSLPREWKSKKAHPEDFFNDHVH